MRVIGIAKRALRGAVAAMAALFPLAPAAADTVSNIATLSWTDAGGPKTVASNQVDLVIDRSVLPPALAASQLTSSNFSGGPIAQSTCRTSAGDQAFKLQGAAMLPPGTKTSQASATQVRAGLPLVITVTSPQDNRDPLQIDRLTVVLTTSDGDRETLTLVETAPGSGQFVGAIQTAAVPPQPTVGDCILSLHPGEATQLAATRLDGSAIAATSVTPLVDPYGLVFDSASGAPVNGARVTLIDTSTGQPATVFGDDGVSSFPATVITGQATIDAAGNVYTLPVGEYRFPLVRPGSYRLQIVPPAPYLAPSQAPPDALAALRRPDGQPMILLAASYGGVLALSDPAPVRLDIPLDAPAAPLQLTKTASATVAQAGDAVQYRIQITNPDPVRPSGSLTVTDLIPAALRLQPNTVRLDGQQVAYKVSGSTLTLTIPPLAPTQARVLTYVLRVREDARAGTALNRATAVDSVSRASATAGAAIRIDDQALAARVTIIGQVTEGCGGTKGVGRVRLLLEDGSYAVTDRDGRYHFDGVLPGDHVVALEPGTLVGGRKPLLCRNGPRLMGSAQSRIVTGQGGALLRADFAVTAATSAVADKVPALPAIAPDAKAAGAERDWFAGQQPGVAWLFPEPEHNPRAPVVRVAIKHLPGQKVALFIDGKPAAPLSFDGTLKSGDGRVAVSVWRAIDLKARDTHLTAEVRDATGTVVERLARTVHYAAAAWDAQILPERSTLVADGITRPVIALRVTDRDGRPVRHGLVGEFDLPAPYYPAVEADAQQARQLAGLERARPSWRVRGDEGIAYIELEPTTASGALAFDLVLRDGETSRTRRIDAWLNPGDRPWTLVGLASGTLGYETLRRHLEPGTAGSRVIRDGRVAFYAKGRVRGKWLLTLAYDSARRQADTRFGGTIDPLAYYTVYGDRSERRFDAASIRKLYLRLERPQFTALFGDFTTGFTDAQLTRYVRALNGVQAQYGGRRVKAAAFVGDTPYSHRRVELQGVGLAGPYSLRATNLLPNSEQIVIETRDRFRPNLVVNSVTLTRYADYTIDYLSGIVQFRQPILSRDSGFNPNIIVADYELDGLGRRVVNAGGRATWTSAGGRVTLGATAVRDQNDLAKTTLAGADLRARISATTELRAEVAASRSAGVTSTAYLAEAEHHDSRFDLLAYVRQQDQNFGVGQQSLANAGARRFGLDTRLRVSPAFTLLASGWRETQLVTGAARTAAQGGLEYRTGDLSFTGGLTFAQDTLADGQQATSLLAKVAASKKLFDGKLELDAASESAIAGKNQSVDFPSRQTLTARYSFTGAVSLVGSYEIAKGGAIDARTARVGFDVKPWTGAHFTTGLSSQAINELGTRTYAAFGFAQSLAVSKRLTVDASLDSNRALGGVNPATVINPYQPVASGGFLATNGALTETFTALTAGATYRGERWSAAARAQWRRGSVSDIAGVQLSALRQLGDGKALGLLASWTDTKAANGTRTTLGRVALSWANRPADSAWSWLDKLEARYDAISGAVLGQPDAVGSLSQLSGDARSSRILNSLSLNYTPRTSDGTEVGEASVFWGVRWAKDRFGPDDVKGLSNLIGVDGRLNLTDHVEAGASVTGRVSAEGRSIVYAFGPSVSLSLAKNSLVTVGWNVRGFADRDYQDQRYTRAGPYLSLRLKFDGETLESLRR